MDVYGCGEGILVAAQCRNRRNYHIFSTDVVVEIVDEKGEHVAPGDVGHGRSRHWRRRPAFDIVSVGLLDNERQVSLRSTVPYLNAHLFFL